MAATAIAHLTVRAERSAGVTMHAPYKRWTLVAVVMALLVLVGFLSLSGGPRATSNAVAITFVGYTNPPGDRWRFALFCVSNQAPYTVRWRGDSVELERKPGLIWPPIINLSLPGGPPRRLTLKAGGSLRVAIGEPDDDVESGRWRFAMSYARYDWRNRWADFTSRHALPLYPRAWVFGDIQRAFNPSNNVIATTAWLTPPGRGNQQPQMNTDGH